MAGAAPDNDDGGVWRVYDLLRYIDRLVRYGLLLTGMLTPLHRSSLVGP